MKAKRADYCQASNFMLEMVQTRSAASSVTDHRGNIAVAGGGERVPASFRSITTTDDVSSRSP